MTINEYYGFPEGTIARLDSRLPDMLPNDIEISDINSAYCQFAGYRILKFPKDVKYTNIEKLTWLSSGIRGIIDIDIEKCSKFSYTLNSVQYLPILDISNAEDVDNMLSSYIRVFGIKGIYKLVANPYDGKLSEAELFQYEGKYKKYYNPFISPLPSTTRKIAFGPTEISVYISDNLVYVTSGDVTIGGIPATYRYGGEWYITKDFTGEEKSQDLEVRYNGELLGYASPLNDGEFYIGENQPVIYEGEALNNIMASNTNWNYDSSNGYWVANSLPATMVLNASGRIKITANPNRKNYNRITVSDANGNTLGSYDAPFSKIVSNTTDSITIKADGYTFDGNPTISKVIVNMPDIPNDRPLLFEWTPAGSGMYAKTLTGNKDIPSNVTQVYAGDYLDILGIDAHSSTLQKFIKYDNSISSKRTDFSMAWDDCTALTEFPLIDTSNGTDFFAAWDGCSALTKFPLLNTSKGTNFSCAWRDCSSLTEFPMLDTSKGTNFSQAWRGCMALTTMSQLDLSSGTNFSYAWWDCASLTELPALNMSNGTDLSYAWRGCLNLVNLGGFGEIKESIDLQDSTKLTVDSIMNVINQSANLNELGITGKTMKFGSTNLNKLTDEQKAVATNKGWTLS